MENKTRGGRSAKKKRVFPNHECLAPSTPTSRFPTLSVKREKIGLVLQESMHGAKNDCNVRGFERNNKYHVSQEFNVLF